MPVLVVTKSLCGFVAKNYMKARCRRLNSMALNI